MSQQVNLFNPVFLKQKKIFSTLAMAQSLGIILLGFGALAFYGDQRVAALDKEAAASKAQLTVTEARLVRVNLEFAPRQVDKAIEAEIASTQAELTSLRQASAVLKRGEFGNTQGYSAYFRAFARQGVSGLWLTGVSIVGAGTEIGLEGRALAPNLIPNYISRLAKESVLQGKSFASLEISAPPSKAFTVASDASKVGAPFLEFALQSRLTDVRAAVTK